MTTKLQSGGASLGRAYVLILIGLVAHVFTAPWVKIANFEPSTSAILRCAIGLLALLPFAYREMKTIGPINKQGVILSIIGGIFLGIDFTAFNYSIFYAGSGIAAILLNLQVIILPALAFFFDKERIPRSYFIIAPLMILGVVLAGGTFNDTTEVDPSLPTTIYGININLLGTLCGMASGCCYGFYLYFSRKSSRINPRGQYIQPMAWSIAAQLIGPALFIMFITPTRGFDLTHGVLVNGVLPLNPETAVGDPITTASWIYMIVLGVIGQAMCWTFIQYGAARLNPTIVAGLLLLSPIATVALAAPIMMGETLSILQIIGVVMVISLVGYQNNVHKLLFKRDPTKTIASPDLVK